MRQGRSTVVVKLDMCHARRRSRAIGIVREVDKKQSSKFFSLSSFFFPLVFRLSLFWLLTFWLFGS